jgi:hypothetical protein
LDYAVEHLLSFIMCFDEVDTDVSGETEVVEKTALEHPGDARLLSYFAEEVQVLAR